MNGYIPIADMFGQRSKTGRGFRPTDLSSASPMNTGGLSRKVQLLELCARIGYTPHIHSSVIDFDLSNALLEDHPCRNNTLS